MASRPVLRRGDTGPAVSYMQSLLPHGFDGDFGPQTESEVRAYQASRGLVADGVVGDQTWAALESHAPPLMPELPDEDEAAIMFIAASSEIASYEWLDRGTAPLGYIQGMALSFVQSYLRLRDKDDAVLEMAKADTYDDDTDALSWYRSNFEALGMSNEHSGATTLRHLYVLMIGLGMRESSGQHCVGRDTSADNVSSDTAEAGLFQTSYNAHVCHPTFDPLMDQYERNELDDFAQVFSRDVSCSSSEWDCYGSGRGYDFQALCKSVPAFAVESCALTLRNLRQHYGPINRKEAELRGEADSMLRAVQLYIDRREAWI